MPVLKATFPELDDLPEAERNELLLRCIDSPVVQALSRQHQWLVRAAFLLIPIGLILILIRDQIGIPVSVLPLIPLVAAGGFAATFIVSFIAFHIRSNRAIKQMIAQELEAVA